MGQNPLRLNYLGNYWLYRQQMSDVVITNVRLTKEQARDLDLLIKKKLYSSRAEAIREFLREYIREQEAKK